jgi:hypothetical protein
VKKTASWCTRGTRPARNARAALFGGTQAFVEAVVQGKPRPLLYAITRATFAATAMNEHRLVARARANARSSEYADLTADVLNHLLDLPTTPALPPAKSPLPSAEPGGHAAQPVAVTSKPRTQQ